MTEHDTIVGMLHIFSAKQLMSAAHYELILAQN